MFCEHCGVKKEEGAIFCQGCGKKAETATEKVEHQDFDPQTESTPLKLSDDIFYSREWNQKASFVISSLPVVDILMDDKNLYIIKLPKYHSSTTGTIIGFIVLSLIGAAIGNSIGASSDRRKREWYRSAWVNTEGKVTSREYLNNLVTRIPLNSLKDKIIFEKKKLILMIDGKKIKLKKNQVALDRFKEKIKSYVL